MAQKRQIIVQKKGKYSQLKASCFFIIINHITVVPANKGHPFDDNTVSVSYYFTTCSTSATSALPDEKWSYKASGLVRRCIIMKNRYSRYFPGVL